MSILLGYFVAVVITIAFACRSLSYFWEQYTNPETEEMCIDISQFFLVNGIAAVLIGAMILCVPTPIICRLQMPKTQRLAVISILLLAGFICVAGIVRVVFLDKNLHSNACHFTRVRVVLRRAIYRHCVRLSSTFSPFFRRWWAILGVKKSALNKREYYGTGGSGIHRSRPHRSRPHRSRPQATKDEEDDKSHGDEVQLSSFPGWPLNFLRGKDSRDDIAAS
ncbi:hypothetical protein N7467_001759 [Penicillium canescens]|nr:hypothetical protein N7467_001759 [Penicillium canescens]